MVDFVDKRVGGETGRKHFVSIREKDNRLLFSEL
jgi:hypothetical protein